MRNVHKMTILATAMIVAVAIWMKTTSDSVFSEETQVTPIAVGDDLEESSSPERHSEPELKELRAQEPGLSPQTDSSNQRIKFSQKFYNAKTGVDAQSVIDELYDQGMTEEAEEAETVLAEMCQIRPEQTNIDVLKGTLERLNSYCNGVYLSDDELVDIKARWRNKYSDDVTKLREQYLGTPRDRRDSWLREMIADASSWHDLEMIRNLINTVPFIDKRDTKGFDLGQDGAIFSGANGRRVQRAALHLYQCEKFAGGYCGPNNIRTIENCFHTGLCQPGWSLQDYYANAYSNLEWEQIELVMAFLRELDDD